MIILGFIAKIGHVLLFPFEVLLPRCLKYVKKTLRGIFNLLIEKTKKAVSEVTNKAIKMKSDVSNRNRHMQLSFLQKRAAKKQKKAEKKQKEEQLEIQLEDIKKEKLEIECPNWFLKGLRWISNFLKGLLRFTLIYGFGFVSALMLVLLPYQVWLWWQELPNPDLLVTENYTKTTKIFDRNDQLLYEIYVDKNYNPVRLDQIPQSVIDATIASEDSQFYHHVGFRPESIMRAAYKIWKNEEVQGGSTITQQLIKNVLLTPERTIERKIKEVVLAVLVESKYSKEQILELYLNNIPYGGEAWGIQSASKKYFGKDVWELTSAEASMLAGLPSAPTTYSPLTDPEIAKERQKYVLDRMVDTGYLTREKADETYTENLVYKEEIQYIRAPHFVDYIRKDLESRYGKRFVELGGLTVKTTLDIDLQEKVQKIVTDGVVANSRLNISNGAAVVLEPQDAEILAYVGSVDYFRDGWGAYDVASAYRQPGSSIKAVTYALALANGYTPASIIKDSPVTFQIAGARPYTPVNYDGKFHGNVTLRAALANSYNIPAVRLSYALGPDNIVSLGKQMGLTNWNVDGSYGLSVTLGGKEVRLSDLTNVYGTFARKGIYKELNPYISVKDSRGFEIYANKPRVEQRAITEEVSYLIWHVLSDNYARLPAFGTQSALTLKGRTVAVKTGTTDQKRDNWTFGFTPSYAVGVWVGNNDNKPMNQYLASGLSGAAPIWNSIFDELTKNKPDDPMIMPDGVFVKIYKECGNRSEVFIKGSTIPATICPKEEKKDEDKDKKDSSDKKEEEDN